MRGLLGQDIQRSRQILRKLLVGRLECRAFDEGEGETRRVGYRFTGRGTYAPLLPAGLSTPEVVTPAGFEPAILTLKGTRCAQYLRGLLVQLRQRAVINGDFNPHLS